MWMMLKPLRHVDEVDQSFAGLHFHGQLKLVASLSSTHGSGNPGHLLHNWSIQSAPGLF